MKVWVAVCCDNIAGVASTLEKADELYGCGHSQDSVCCFTEECDVDAVRKPDWHPPRHQAPIMQEVFPL